MVIFYSTKKSKNALKLHLNTFRRVNDAKLACDVVCGGLTIRQWWDADSFRNDARC